MSEIVLTPTPADPAPSVRTPAGLYVWDAGLGALRNVSVEAPNAPELPWGVEVWVDQVSAGRMLVGSLSLLSDILRGLSLLMLARRPVPFVQARCSYSTGGTLTWVDPSLPDPVLDTAAHWPADWNGMLNAELQVRLGLGDRV